MFMNEFALIALARFTLLLPSASRLQYTTECGRFTMQYLLYKIMIR